MRKLTKREKADLFYKIDYEGGLPAAIEHGAVLDIAKGTALEKPFVDLAKAMAAAEKAIGKQDLEQAIADLEETNDESDYDN